MSKCCLCPRRCAADRENGELGYCRQKNKITVARSSLHMWEEPPISGKNGSGTVFFCGCSLRCVFCQNRDISRGRIAGTEVTPYELSRIMLDLQSAGAHNINLVTPTHFADLIAQAIEIAKPSLYIPVIYNCGGYELPGTIERMRGLIDIYMPDFKYFSSELSGKYSGAPDYCRVATEAVKAMYAQVGKIEFDSNGMLKKGVIVRHLVLPGCRHDSMKVLKTLAQAVPPDNGNILLSLMNQYTPDFALDCEYKNLHRKLTSFEYESVLEYAASLGFEGFCQQRSAASPSYTPDFGVKEKKGNQV